VSTELVAHNGVGAALFVGTPKEVIGTATEIANELRDVIRKQRLSMGIGGREHVQIEGWQTLATFTQCAAVKDSGVVEIPWPAMIALPEEPPAPGREPPRNLPEWQAWQDSSTLRRAWEHHRDLLGARNRGLCYGYKSSWIVKRSGEDIGWGEGMCTRAEPNWTTKPDHQLASMSQTRGQSRAFSSPLKFIVKLAGFEPTPAEEMEPGATVIDADAQQRIAELEAELAALKARAGEGVVLLGDDDVAEVAKELQARWPGLDGHAFMRVLDKRFKGQIPESAGIALRAWVWWATNNESQEQANV
jgi:hypothetical protein